MAKTLKAVAAELTDTGVRFGFERLGEKFTWDADVPALEGLAQVAMRGMIAKGAAMRRPVETIRFADKPDRDGQPPVLTVETQDGVIGLDLTWAQVLALSKLAEGMLQHAPTPDRPT
jgi:hypothetical protein